MNSYGREDLNILADEELVCMAKEGSGSAYDFLIEKYRDLAKTIAKKYFIAGGDNEDVIQEGMIGIFKAVRDYDEGKNASFRTFATLCIERQIQTAVSGANREKHKILNESISINLPTKDAGDEAGTNEVEMGSVIPSPGSDNPENLTLLRESFAELRKLSEVVLSDLEMQVFQGLVEGKSYREIAEALGKSPKSIDNAVQRVKRKLGVNN